MRFWSENQEATPCWLMVFARIRGVDPRSWRNYKSINSREVALSESLLTVLDLHPHLRLSSSLTCPKAQPKIAAP
jgi:hypothetical protein